MDRRSPKCCIWLPSPSSINHDDSSATSAKRLLLLRTLDIMQITYTIFGVELDADAVSQSCLAIVQSTCFDASHIRHNLELGVQAGPAGATEEVLVDLARVALGVPGLGFPYAS